MRSDKPITSDASATTPVRADATGDASNVTDMKMSPEDFAGLRAQVAAVMLQDVLVGRVLLEMLRHQGHSYGLDFDQEDARIAAQAREDARADEDADLKVAADDRAAARTAEDSQPHSADEQTAITARRSAEDAQLKTDADALKQKRDDEDAATKDAASAKSDQAKADKAAQASAQAASKKAPAQSQSTPVIDQSSTSSGFGGMTPDKGA